MIKETSKGCQIQRGAGLRSQVPVSHREEFAFILCEMERVERTGHRIMSVVWRKSHLQKFEEVKAREIQK